MIVAGNDWQKRREGGVRTKSAEICVTAQMLSALMMEGRREGGV